MGTWTNQLNQLAEHPARLNILAVNANAITANCNCAYCTNSFWQSAGSENMTTDDHGIASDVQKYSNGEYQTSAGLKGSAAAGARKECKFALFDQAQPVNCGNHCDHRAYIGNTTHVGKCWLYSNDPHVPTANAGSSDHASYSCYTKP